MPRVPRELGVKKGERKRVIRALSALPQVEPEIAIAPVQGEGREVVFNPGTQCSLPLVAGTQGFCADYDALTHEWLEATAEWRRRWVRSRGTWYLDTYGLGGSWYDGRFHLGWRSRWLHHPSPSAVHVLNEWDITIKRIERRVTPDARAKWADDEHCHGPSEGGSLLAGNAIVQVGEQEFDCVRAILVRLDDWYDQDELEPDEPRVEWGFLDDIYLTDSGRMVLTRRFISQQDHEWNAWGNRKHGLGEPPTWDEWSAGRARIVYNGIEFRHYFNTLTDISLGWPAEPPFR